MRRAQGASWWTYLAIIYASLADMALDVVEFVAAVLEMRSVWNRLGDECASGTISSGLLLDGDTRGLVGCARSGGISTRLR